MNITVHCKYVVIIKMRVAGKECSLAAQLFIVTFESICYFSWTCCSTAIRVLYCMKNIMHNMLWTQGTNLQPHIPPPLTELRSPGLLPSPSRAQLAACSVIEFGGLHGAGGIGSLTQPLLGERIQAALKPNRVAVVDPGDSLDGLAERHGSTVTTLHSLNPTITARPSEQLPPGSWLFLPRRRTATGTATNTTNQAAGFHTPETLATYLGVSLSTIYSWNSSGYGPPFVKLGNLVRYTYEDVELWLARQLELSRG